MKASSTILITVISDEILESMKIGQDVLWEKGRVMNIYSKNKLTVNGISLIYAGLLVCWPMRSVMMCNKENYVGHEV